MGLGFLVANILLEMDKPIEHLPTHLVASLYDVEAE